MPLPIVRLAPDEKKRRLTNPGAERVRERERRRVRMSKSHIFPAAAQCFLDTLVALHFTPVSESVIGQGFGLV